MQFAPRSLYRSCLEFIGCHTHLIDSLVGLPEIIGKDIFETSLKDLPDRLFRSNSRQHLTENRSLIAGKLKIFFDAYGDGDILESLSLKESQLFFNDIIDDCWWILQNLSHLDLSSCGLGDGHDALPSLFSVLGLQTLILRDNCMTDEGIRKLTVQARYKRKESSVRCLDLSDNEGITNKSLQFLKCLQNLALLNVSSTSVMSEGYGVPPTWHTCSGQEVCQCISSSFLVKTAGWAADVAESWKLSYVAANELSSSHSLNTDLSVPSSTENFYSRKRSVAFDRKLPCKPVRSCIKKILIFVSELFTCPHFRPVNEVSPENFNKKAVIHCFPQSIHLLSSDSKNVKHGKIPNEKETVMIDNVKPVKNDDVLSHCVELFSDSDASHSIISQYKKPITSNLGIKGTSSNSEHEIPAQRVVTKIKNTSYPNDRSSAYQCYLTIDSTHEIPRNVLPQCADETKHSRHQSQAVDQNAASGSKVLVSKSKYCTSENLSSPQSNSDDCTLDGDAFLCKYINSPVTKKRKKLSVLQLLDEYL